MSDKGDSARAAQGACGGPGYDVLMCRALHRGSFTPAPVKAPIQGLTTLLSGIRRVFGPC
ncbi:hypothetical protein [Roseovarius marisflavi]|uniref:hypothetical protein n=1 Tax=Roseovarius marisflavi TaxID=1054996 RepID=UPI001C65F44B|nr:hypothetical protein [Roseovarius marisflavi]